MPKICYNCLRYVAIARQLPKTLYAVGEDFRQENIESWTDNK